MTGPTLDDNGGVRQKMSQLFCGPRRGLKVEVTHQDEHRGFQVVECVSGGLDIDCDLGVVDRGGTGGRLFGLA